MTPYSPASALAAVFLCGALFFAVGVAGSLLRGRRPHWITSALVVVLTGYGIFWLGFWRPEVGRIASWVVVIGALAVVVWRAAAVWALVRRHGWVFAIMLLTALLYVGTLERVATSSWSVRARTRFVGMPGDNDIPRILADMTRSGSRSRILGGDWLTSDRPPLQTGAILLVLPVLNTLRFDLDTASAAAGFWLQLLWIPASYLLLRRLGATANASGAAVAMLAFTGFLFFNSVYLWPKLAAAAFVLTAALEWFIPREELPDSSRFARAGACAACGWLLHGGVMFGLVALAPFVLLRWRSWRGWLWAAGVFIVLVSPWLAYQHWYAPPGNRLPKWHIGGDIGPDDLTFTQAIRRSYEQVGWRGAWETRRLNAAMLAGGNWREMATFWRADEAPGRRQNETFFPLRTGAFWWAGLIGWAIVLLRRRRHDCMSAEQTHASGYLFPAAWLLLTLLAWAALMFFPHQVFTHQGTYTTQLLLITLLAAGALAAHPLVFFAVASLQCADFFTTWPASPLPEGGAAHPLMLGLVVAAAAGLIGIAGLRLSTATDPKAEHAFRS